MSANKTEKFEQGIENTQENLSKIAKDLGKETKRFVKNKEEEIKDLTEACCDHIKEHPIRSVLIGFAAGVLLSKIFGK